MRLLLSSLTLVVTACATTPAGHSSAASGATPQVSTAPTTIAPHDGDLARLRSSIDSAVRALPISVSAASVIFQSLVDRRSCPGRAWPKPCPGGKKVGQGPRIQLGPLRQTPEGV